MNKGYIMPQWFFYLVSFTWGLPMTILGFIVAGFLLLTGRKPQRFCYGWQFTFPTGGGAVDIGMIAIVPPNASLHLQQHEFGHSIQNCIFGPLVFIFIWIPSVLRYWYREINHITEPEYDYAWFEQQASMFGKRYYEAINREKS